MLGPNSDGSWSILSFRRGINFVFSGVYFHRVETCALSCCTSLHTYNIDATVVTESPLHSLPPQQHAREPH
jgi:hypothetical protein